MKRVASHYLFIPGKGFMKKYIIEINQGVVVRYYPFSIEVENTEWFPGVIELSPTEKGMVAYLLFPFDFTEMKPVGETQRKLLQ